MRTRYARKLRSKRARRTRRRSISRRRSQKGGWGGMNQDNKNQNMSVMMYGGWGGPMVMG